MVERLRRLLTKTEKEFCRLVLLGNETKLRINTKTMSEEIYISVPVMRSTIRALEIAGFVKSKKINRNTIVVKIVSKEKIRQVVEE